MSECVICGRLVPEMEMVTKVVVCGRPECQQIAVDSVVFCRDELQPLPNAAAPSHPIGLPIGPVISAVPSFFSSSGQMGSV